MPQITTNNEDPDNFVKNGNAEYANFQHWKASPGAPKSGYICKDAKNGNFAFCVKNPKVYYLHSNIFPIKPEKSYELSGNFKVAGSNSPLVLGLFLYDQNKRRINQCNIRSIKNTETELNAPCKKGDKVIYVKNASRWRKKGYCVAFEPEKGLPNFKVSSRISSISQSDGNWTIKLRAPCPFTYPAGTKVAENGVGGPCGIFPSFSNLTEQWGSDKKIITSAMLKRWPNAKYASVAILPKISKSENKKKIFFDDISLRETN
jgi:hypothetical protein